MKPDTPPPDHPSYRPDIDGLRAIAILSVLGFHAFPAWVPGGFIGVDIFFVISGFLISGILLSQLRAGRLSIAAFYARRIRRIFPALLLVLIATCIAGFYLLWPGEYRQLGKHIVGGAAFIVNFMLAGESGYFDNQAETKPLLHLWSLGVEEQFYIFWPLLLWAAWQWKHRAGLLIAAVIAASFATNLWLATQDLTVDFYSPLSRFWELLAGGALAWAGQVEKPVLRLSSRNAGHALSLIGLAFIITALFAFDKTMDFPGWRALLPVCGAGLLIAAGETAFINHRLLSNRAMIGIGLISYPLYLWHWPLLSFAQILSGQSPDRVIRIGMIALSFLLATLTYALVERPIRKQALHKKITGILLAVMIVVAGAGGLLWHRDGLPKRFTGDHLIAEALDGDRLIATWQHSVRMHTCHLQDKDETTQAPQCIETQRPLVLLWGDSHAAALYPGLKHLQLTHGFGIAQLTQAGCPPLLDIPKLTFRKDCNALNRRIMTQLPQLHPELILLAAAYIHSDYPMQTNEIIGRLVRTVAKIKQASPDSKIIVIGPGPRWLSPLPSVYRRALTFNHSTPPPRMADYLDPNVTALDATMRAQLAAHNIDYLSEQAQLCDASGCQTRLGDGIDSLTYIDEGHVSTVASIYLLNQFAPQILDALGLPLTQ